jgi:GGDEF domain-containing protein
MSTLLTALATAAPVSAGWALHVLWLRRRLRTARRDPLTGLRTREGFTRRATALLRDERAVVVLADVATSSRSTTGTATRPGTRC